ANAARDKSGTPKSFNGRMPTATRSSTTSKAHETGVSEAAPHHFLIEPSVLGRAQTAGVADAKVRWVRAGLVSAVTALPGLLVAQVQLGAAQRPRSHQLVGGFSSGVFPQLRGRRSLQRRGSRTRRGSAGHRQPARTRSRAPLRAAGRNRF